MIQKYSLFLLVSCILISCKEGTSTLSDQGEKLFQLVDNGASGIDFSNDVQISQILNAFTYKYVYNGGGVASADLDGDTLPELIFTSNQNGIHLYKNLGNLKFQKVEQSGMTTDNLWLTGVTVCDVNEDGMMDVYVCASGPYSKSSNHLFMNQGNLKFKDEAVSLGVADEGRSTQAVFFDADKDGDQDLYVSNHPIDFNAGMDTYIAKSKNPDYREQDRFYENHDGKFTDITAKAGLKNYGFSLSASIGDLNDDGLLDIYVANDFHTPDHYFINNGDLTFRDELKSTFAHVSNFSMGTDIGDINNDGLLDLVELDMVSADPRRKKTQMPSMAPEAFWFTVDFGYHYQYMTNVLQINNGLGNFSDIASLAGVASTDWSWGPLFTDLNGDGWKDIFISNGIRKDVNDQDYNISLRTKASMGMKVDYALANLKMPQAKVANFAFQNNQDLTFQNSSNEWGLDFSGFSTGAIASDLDNDGDIDVVINNIDTLALIFENTLSSTDHHSYITINTIDGLNHRNTPGNRVSIWQDGQKQMIEQSYNHGFQSSTDPTVIFGLASRPIDSIEIYWYNSGTYQTIINPPVNQTLTINQDGDRRLSPKKTNPLFTKHDAHGLEFQRSENEFDDYAVQVLLPHELSTWGYAMAEGDINADGLEDVFIGGAAGQAGAIFTQQPNGTFRKQYYNALSTDQKHEDYGSIWSDIDGDGYQDLFVVSGGYELEDPTLYRDRLYLNDGQGGLKSAIYTQRGYAGSCAQVLDIDNDGATEIMVGGRFTPSKYPRSEPTVIYTFSNGALVDNTTKFMTSSVGVVNDIRVADMDNDGDQDIITAGEWEPIRIHYNNDGTLQTKQIDNSEGWWFNLNIADFDKDGSQDIFAGNLGMNYKYSASETEPFTVFHDNFDDDDTYDIVLSYYHQGTQRPLRGRQCSSEQLPYIAKKFKSYNSFADATIDDMLGKERFDSANKGIAKTFASTIFFNKGNTHFQSKPLPKEAQISSINSSLIKDFNNDGNLDVLLAGNLYSSEVETPRNDASIGLLLSGEGNGNFTVIPAPQSGISIEGWVKAMTTIGVGKDPLIVIGKNDGLQTLTYPSIEE